MTPLRKRFIEDLKLRNYAPGTIQNYVYHVARFARYHGRSPEQLGQEAVRRYFLHLIEKGEISWSHYNVAVCALRFFYRTTLGEKWPVQHLPYAKRPKKLPAVLSDQEVVSLLQCLPNISHRMALLTIYATGLRISEALRLRPQDIDSRRMFLQVHSGKGGKDRLVPLSPVLLDALRQYWRICRPKRWLFPNVLGQRPMHPAVVGSACRKAARAAGLSKRVTPHTFRHSFATRLLEAGVDVRTIQKVLGHSSLRTTMLYTHVSLGRMQAVANPLDPLALEVPRLLDGLPAADSNSATSSAGMAPPSLNSEPADCRSRKSMS